MKSLFLKFLSTAFLAAVVAACSDGGSGVAGIGGSGYIATGSVTGFGSVFVNGVEFHTDSSTTYEIEDQLLYDQLQEQNYLSIGMVVQVEGSINPDGISGVATKIRFGDNVEGPITSAITNPDGNELRFSVMGISVTAHATNTKFSGTDFNTLAPNNLIEISGYYDQNSVLRATYIELKQSSFDANNHKVELEGLISGFNGSTNFMVQGVSVNASAVSLSGLANGKYVEVKGHYTGSVLNASEIETEELDLKDDGSDVSIEGYITRYVDNSNFDVNGIRVNASGSSFEPATLETQLRLGLEVEVEGNIINGILIAEEVEAEGGDAEIHATITGSPNTVAGTFDLSVVAGQSAVTVQVTSSTTLEDESTGPIGIVDLMDSDFVEVTGFESDINNHTVIASKIKRRSPDDIILQGYAMLSSGSAAAGGTITILGVNFPYDTSTYNPGGTTDFEDESDVAMDDTAIDNLLSGISTTTPALLKIKDVNNTSNNAIGVADEVDMED